MIENSALCLRFDLDTFSSRDAYTADVGWGAYKYLPRLLRIAAVHGVKFQFCACGQGVKEYPFETQSVFRAGHSIDSHLHTHRVTLLDEVDQVAEELAMAENEFAKKQLAWSGIGATGMYPNGIDNKPDVQQLLSERGYQWCSAKYNADLPLDDMQPYWLNEFLLEIPCAGISDRMHFGNAKATLEEFIQHCTNLLQQAQAKGLVYAIDLHPGVLAKFDPECTFVTALADRAVELGVPLVTMDQITQWQIACREIRAFAEGERDGQISACWHDGGMSDDDQPAEAPPALHRYLKADQKWNNEFAQPIAQPEKVLDYVGGWRTFPNSRRLGVTINRFGLRGQDCLRTKPGNVTRLLCIGDSCVFGCPPDDAPWPAQLQERLDQKRPSVYQVLNGGVNGHSSGNVSLRLPQIIRGLRPDTVLISVLANDAWTFEPPSGTDLSRFVPETFVQNVQYAIDCCVKHGVKPILITPPGMVPRDHKMTPFMMRVFHQALWLEAPKQPNTMRLLYDRYNQDLRDLAKKNEIECIDTAAAFDKLYDGQRGQLFLDTCHMNQQGNAAMAKIIAETIIEDGLT